MKTPSFPITLSSEAKSHLINILAKQPNSLGILLGVKAAGCSGLTYVLEILNPASIAESKQPELSQLERVFEEIDLTIYWRPEHRAFLKDIQLVCIDDGLGRFIQFKNPNAKGECGCGESFSVLDPKTT